MATEKRVLTSVCYTTMLFAVAFFILGVILSDGSQPIAVLLDVRFPPFYLAGVLSCCLGFMSLLQAVTGLCGTIKERRCFLFLFIISVVISVVLQAAVIYLTLIFSSNLTYDISQSIMGKMYLYPPELNGTKTDLVQTWDFTQQKEGCCGTLSPLDWGNLTYFEQGTYPDSCCLNMTYGCGLTVGEFDVYEKGCIDAIVYNTFVALILTAVASVSLFLPELLGFLSANLVMKTIKIKQKFRRM